MPTKNKNSSTSYSTTSNINSSPTPKSTRTFTQEEISACARAIWEEKGCPEGRDEENWFEAERRLQGGASSQKKEDPAFANPTVPFNLDNEPTGRVERRLRQGAAPAQGRSATSL